MAKNEKFLEFCSPSHSSFQKKEIGVKIRVHLVTDAKKCQKSQK